MYAGELLEISQGDEIVALWRLIVVILMPADVIMDLRLFEAHPHAGAYLRSEIPLGA